MVILCVTDNGLITEMLFEEWMIWASAEKHPEWIYFFADEEILQDVDWYLIIYIIEHEGGKVSSKVKVLYEDQNIRVVHRSSKGKERPAHISIRMSPRTTTSHERLLNLSIDELFDLTEILDDICDAIEDAEEGSV